MKNISLVLLVFLLFYLSRGQAQTASSAPVTKFYSPLVQEKIQEAARAPHPNNDRKSMPGIAPVDKEKVNNRNKKYVTRVPK